jgi:NADPH:quinone reductase-like Zn-dependent oxidoreductase
MRAVGYKTAGPIDHPTSLHDIELPNPEAKGRDLLVEIRAVSVNPVDTKVRKRAGADDGGWKVLGYDAAGVVAAVGPEASLVTPSSTRAPSGGREPIPSSTSWMSGSSAASRRR